MNDFLQTVLTFPTLPYSILLAFCVVYWMLAATGLLDGDAIDGLLGSDGDPGDSTATAGIVARMGLGGVPLMVVIAVLSFCAWLATYFVQLLVLSHLPGPLRMLAGVVTLVAALIPGVLVTSALLRPLSKLINRLSPPIARSILGRAGTVISPCVDADSGRAEFDDGGAGLILQVRTLPGSIFQRGERVVLLSYDEQANTHAVISETDFNNR